MKFPSATDIEQSIIGHVLNEPRKLREAELSPDYFYDSNHAKIWESLIKLEKQHHTFDVNMVNQLYDDPEIRNTILKCYGTGWSPAFNEYVNILKQIAARRKAIQIFHDEAPKFLDLDVDPYQVINDVTTQLMEILNDDVKTDAVTMDFAMDESLKQLSGMYSGKLRDTGIKTGIRKLDETLGRIHPQLIIIGARPSMGKSSFAVQLANNLSVAQKIPGAIFSLEMSRETLTRWIISQRTGINNEELKKGTITEDQYRNIMEEESYSISSSPLLIDDSTGYNILNLRSKVVRLKQRHDIQYLIVDYIQLLSAVDAKGKIRNRENEVSEISRGLKLISKELKIPVFALCQLNRNVTSRADPTPHLADLRESGALEQDADVVILIHRPEYYNQDEWEGHSVEGLAVLLIRKHRDGRTGFVKTKFTPECLQFSDDQ